jgi:hypothetical protein
MSEEQIPAIPNTADKLLASIDEAKDRRKEDLRVPHATLVRRLGALTRSFVKIGENRQAKPELSDVYGNAHQKVQSFIEAPAVLEEMKNATNDVVATYKHEDKDKKVLTIEAVYHKEGVKPLLVPDSDLWSLVVHEDGKKPRRVMFHHREGIQGRVEGSRLAVDDLVDEHAGRLSSGHNASFYTPAEQMQLYSTIGNAFDILSAGLESGETTVTELEGTYFAHVAEQEYYKPSKQSVPTGTIPTARISGF